ncbi:hypothetical protein JKP88DRAFT_214812, partial [Tribonema minus]
TKSMLLALHVRLHLVHLQMCPASAYMTFMRINCMTPLEVLSHTRVLAPPPLHPSVLTHIRHQHVVLEAVPNWLLDQHRKQCPAPSSHSLCACCAPDPIRLLLQHCMLQVPCSVAPCCM